MPDIRHYYLDETNKVIKHFADAPETAPEGFVFCGSSGMNIKAASGFYAKNQEGFSIVDGDPQPEESETADDQGHHVPAD